MSVTNQAPDFTASIVGIERLRSSFYGNPRFRIMFDNGYSYPTGPDCSIAYGIENSEYRAGPVQVWLERGNIVYAKPGGSTQ